MSKQLGKNAAILTGSKVLTMTIGLVTGMLLSRFRTLEEYGTYSQITIVISLATALFTLGLPNSTNYFLALYETHAERQHFLSVYYTINTLLCVIMGVTLAYCTPVVVSYFSNPLIREFTYVLVLLPWTRVVISSISNIMVVYEKTAQLTIFNAISMSVSLVAVLLTKFFNQSFREYMLIFMAGEIILTLAVYAIVWQLEKPLFVCFDKQLIVKIFRYSIPIGLSSLVGTVSLEVDKLMIGSFLNTEQLAIYTNAAKELPLTIVSSSLTAVLLPQMARMLKKKDSKGAISLWGETVQLSFLFICFCTSALVAFAPQIITLLYSEKYLPGVSVFRVYAIVLLLRCTYFGVALNSIGKTKIIFTTSILTLFLNVVLNYALFTLLGMTGPAVATLLSIATGNMTQLFVTAKYLNTTLAKLFPWRKLGKIALLNMLLCAFWLFFCQIFSIGTSPLDIFIAIGLGAVGMIVYVLVVWKPVSRLWRAINEVD